MRSLCFLSMDDLGSYVADDDLAIKPLAELGYEVETVSWRAKRRWADFEAVIIRTPWDYQQFPDEFLATLEEIEHETRLMNPLSTARWNFNKTYLQELASNGVEIVPTLWDERYSTNSFDSWLDRLATDEVIVKPTVSATAAYTYRLREYDPSLESVFSAREFMVQPFMPAIVSEGEFSLFYFNGIFSHAILKAPKGADFRVQEEHGGIITAIEPEKKLLDAAEIVLSRIEPDLLYSRVDLVRHADGFALMELELIEPALYLRTDAEAPARFANAIATRLTHVSR